MNEVRFRKILSVIFLVTLGVVANIANADPMPFAVTLSGGVSLGAYQAGSLYYAGLVVKENPLLFETKLLTGASAGALNAIHTVLSVCGEETSVPSDSAIYRSWVGFQGRDFISSTSQTEALLSRDAFDGIAKDLEAKWRRGLPQSCDVVVGLSVTRLHALEDLSKIGFARQGEKVVLRIRGRGVGVAPRLTNYVNPSRFPKPLLLELVPNDDAQNFRALKEVLFASAAFPVAFAPQTLRTCVAKSTDVWAHADLPFQCPSEEVEAAKFLDGGILDNKPLALAEKLVRSGLGRGPGAGTRWRELPLGDDADPEVRASVLYFYSDLAATTYAISKPKDDTVAFAIAPMLLGNVFNPTRNQDSSALLESSPSFETQIAAPKSNIPRMGDSLFGFFGFFEREFRSFDFYLGLWETREFIRTSVRTTLRQGDRAIGNEIQLPQIEPSSDDAKKLECLDATFKEEARSEFVCSRIAPGPEGVSQFPILARLALARRKEKRPDFEFMVRRLAHDGYEFRDLGLRKDEAWRAPARIKSESIRAMSKLASSQSLPENIAFRAAGPIVLNAIEPLPIENDFTISVGPQSLFTFSSLVAQNESFRSRWAFGVGLEGLIATPFTGFEFEPAKFQTNLLQTRFSLGVGYKETDVTTRAGLSFTLAERLRLQTDVEAVPFRKDGPRPWRILPSVGIQFYF